ncbi:uncharacterized protein FIBRA_07746 [Fibroporia radiculosa]|uniref:Uncharacterized protein n=1 Tax=Fibroporia radiculosa TaxID=599839 RepID=J4GVJ1_9APHY|nr:uncharacterized protein FIBRA_07746 [Fibroporia radiculosa]CCM05520.1 predicted protein [Fibroporia radiculosa]
MIFLLTLAYTIFTVAMYTVWWHKPLDVQCPVRIPYCFDPYPHSEDRPGKWATEVWFIRLLVFVMGIQDDERNMRQDKHALTFYSGDWEDRKEVGYMRLSAWGLVMLVTMVFGGMHCIAWSYAFPSHLEMLIWRMSALSITASVALLVEIAASVASIEGGLVLVRMMPGLVLLSAFVVLLWSILLYGMARVLLLVLSFAPPRALPAGAYRNVQWTSFIPHI